MCIHPKAWEIPSDSRAKFGVGNETTVWAPLTLLLDEVHDHVDDNEGAGPPYASTGMQNVLNCRRAYSDKHAILNGDKRKIVLVREKNPLANEPLDERISRCNTHK